jgi:hypothetical protein
MAEQGWLRLFNALHGQEQQQQEQLDKEHEK